ncbi:MAG: GNAT family N-acetyltransferase [Eubacterium sp.]|nr:GNAT family N-acetyltransferase [Eubacterium sp.]MDE6767858.1 GNAT family N-acetyltransferase [Eubacterium sp.]
MYNIKFIKSSDNEFEFVKRIRTAVFTNEQGANALTEFDDYDNKADFALLFDSDKPVGTARVVRLDKGFKIGRIAVLKEYRGKGYGVVIVRAVLEKAFEKGTDAVYVDAQNYAVPFYEKIGFKVIGDEITDRGLPHIPMMIEKENDYVKKEK